MRFTVLASAALLSACLGQSGSEVIKPPTMNPNPNPTPIDPRHPPIVAPGIPLQPHCPCDGLRDQQQIRATVLGVESFATITNLRRYALRAEEILSDARNGEVPLQPGDHFGGYWQGQLACSGELPPVAVGTEVLAFYRRGWQDGELCCEYIACGDECPAEQESDDGQNKVNSPHESCLQQCRTETADACAQHDEEAVMHGDLMLMPWGDEFVVGISEQGRGQATITEADLHALTLDRDACMGALDDRYDTLYPQEPPSQGMDDDDGQATPPHPTPATPPEQSPPEPMPTTPMMMAQPPPPSATPPPPTNPTAPQVGPPPAHPEELRVRCQ